MFSIRLPRDLDEKLAARSAREGRTKADLIREALVRYLTLWETRYESGNDHSGRYGGGRGDSARDGMGIFREHDRAAKDVEAEAMLLDLDDRAILAEKLILSLDAPSDAENLGLWVGEATRRLKELREGKAGVVALEEVLRRMRSSIS
ncbi:MAG: addiction module protein [Bacteroidota bacterium]